jgi:myo-inositol-1(or 4)-monophosphatase
MSTNPTYDELRRDACELAAIGVRTAKALFGKVGVARKKDDTPVTEADHAAQEAILAALAERHPAHAVLTEEVVASPGRHAALSASDYCWIVDPIDGTRNFCRGVGIWSTAVAVLHRGRPVAGAIQDAVSGQAYHAAAGQGAWFGEQRLKLVDRPVDSDTTLAISSFRRRKIPPAVRAWMDRFLFRNTGSLCLHLAWVAAGLYDAAYAWECKLWDLAAGALLVEEAGGVVTDHDGRPVWPVAVAAYDGSDLPMLAGPPGMHGLLLNDLHSSGQATR